MINVLNMFSNVKHFLMTLVIILGVGIVAFIAGGIYGYFSNHNVQTINHKCDDFRKHLVTGPATDKALNIFKRNGLCD